MCSEDRLPGGRVFSAWHATGEGMSGIKLFENRLHLFLVEAHFLDWPAVLVNRDREDKRVSDTTSSEVYPILCILK